MRERVRVTGPARRTSARGSRARDIDDDTRLGNIYLGSLLRAQLGLALRVLGTLAATVGTWPLVFHLWPGLATVTVLGVPLGWLLLGVAVYPLLVGLGWWYLRRAERHERAFVDLLSTELTDR